MKAVAADLKSALDNTSIEPWTRETPSNAQSRLRLHPIARTAAGTDASASTTPQGTDHIGKRPCPFPQIYSSSLIHPYSECIITMSQRVPKIRWRPGARHVVKQTADAMHGGAKAAIRNTHAAAP